MSEEYTEKLEKDLHNASKELLKQIVRNNRLKAQVEFLIDKLQDIDFVLHGEGARNINWWEISKAYAVRIADRHQWKWGETFEVKESGLIGIVTSLSDDKIYGIIKGEGMKPWAFSPDDISPLIEE